MHRNPSADNVPSSSSKARMAVFAAIIMLVCAALLPEASSVTPTREVQEHRAADGEWRITEFAIAPGQYVVYLNTSFREYASPAKLGWEVYKTPNVRAHTGLGLVSMRGGESGLYVQAESGGTTITDTEASLGETGLRTFPIPTQYFIDNPAQQLGVGTFYLVTHANTRVGEMVVRIDAPIGAIVPTGAVSTGEPRMFTAEDFHGGIQASAVSPTNDPLFGPGLGASVRRGVSLPLDLDSRPMLTLAAGGGTIKAGNVSLTAPSGETLTNGVPGDLIVNMVGHGPGRYVARVDSSIGFSDSTLMLSVVELSFPGE